MNRPKRLKGGENGIPPKKQGGSGKKIANGLVALGSAAVLAVYAAGYYRTRPAADRFAAESAGRRPALQIGAVAQPAAAIRPGSDAKLIISQSVSAGASAVPASSATNVAAVKPNPVVPARPSPKSTAVPKAAPVSVPTETLTALPAEPAPVTAPALPTAIPAPVPTPAIPAATPAPVPTGTSSAEPPPATTAAPQAQYKDGTYSGWGSCRHGDIQASVVVEGGRIVSAVISQCLTRYSCSWIAALPPQVVSRQSANVDYISGATQSADAFYYAVVDALSKAK